MPSSDTESERRWTVDEQIDALKPLGAGTIAALAGYSAGSGQFSSYRQRGNPISRKRLRKLAIKLQELADLAKEMAGPFEESDKPS
jgi:hypothetical protein